MNKKLLIILIIFFFLAVIALYSILFGKKSEIPPLLFPTPTLVKISTKPFYTESLKIVSILPKENLTIKQSPSQFITVIFNFPLELVNFHYKISPFTKTKINKGDIENSIIISPEVMWIEGTTTITISKNTFNIERGNLPYDYVYKINTEFPIGE